LAVAISGTGPDAAAGAVRFGPPTDATGGRGAAAADFVRGGGKPGLDRVDADCELAAGAGDSGAPSGESGVPSFDGGFVGIAI
jgi:hypothetical protein